MNDRWDGPVKISQNGPGNAHEPAHMDPKVSKKKSLKIFFYKTQTGRVKKIMVL
jgi:hypothetical protein